MSTDLQNIRVRFAPSPTGFLHVGGARTAIFNWLFARKYNGKFFLRVEDTDAERSGQEMVDAIIDGMKWLGLDWDDEIIYQSQRIERYSACAGELLNQGKAYKCFCSKEELDAKRDKAKQEKRDFKYRHARTCYNRSAEEIKAYENEGRPYVIRFLLPEGETRFRDEVYGDIKVTHKELDDFVIVRPDGYPVYHLAVVVDDHEMGMTHVIRGDDHLSNTPKHVLLFQSFGWQIPVFAHVPLILGQDKQRLSKRHGATAIGEYAKAGYLAEVMFNFLAILGWSSGDDREVFSRKELLAEFSLPGIQKKGAIFDEKKLEWMNGQYLNDMPDSAFAELVKKELAAKGNDPRIPTIAALLKPRTRLLTEIAEAADYFFNPPLTYEEKGVQKHWKDGQVIIGQLAEIRDALLSMVEFDHAALEEVLRELCEKLNLSAGKLIHPLRLALTGRTFSPGIFEVIELLGKEETVGRINKAIDYIGRNVPEGVEAQN
jgi:glutamyl-tRNA synthetase